MSRSLLLIAVLNLALASTALAQKSETGTHPDIETEISNSQQEKTHPVSTADRAVYRAIQQFKKEMDAKYGLAFAIDDTLIYQHGSGGVDPNDAMVNTLNLYATWKIYRSQSGKDFAGLGFQFESRGNLMDDQMTEFRDGLGTIWSPNDATSKNFTRISQLWWGQKFGEGRFGYQIGKIDTGTLINTNRFAGSTSTQFLSQPLSTNPARSFSDNGLGIQLRAEPANWLYVHFLMADSDAIANHSPFTSINGHWLYAGEIGFKPKIEGLGQGIYRFMVYQRDLADANEFGWALSFDQNLSDDLGVFLRFGTNDGGINSINHLLSGGVSFLAPFGRKNDLAGVGAIYTHPNDNTLRDEYGVEAFYRLQLSDGVDLTADVQVIFNPSASDQGVVTVFGLRARVLF